MKTLLYTDEGIRSTLALWAEFEKGRREARREEGEVEGRKKGQRTRLGKWRLGERMRQEERTKKKFIREA